ncbi:MAG: hypothetical protein AB7S70_05910 [Hyphomicrobium sp.]|uniref:hypothetical protein n=1 Tax=Hyphomicrobium sp. TaxID=82 RepID=UPI003D0FB228
MGALTIYHGLLLLAYCVLMIVPFWRIFPRAGWPSALSLLMPVAPINFILLWALAFKRWPGDA